MPSLYMRPSNDAYGIAAGLSIDYVRSIDHCTQALVLDRKELATPFAPLAEKSVKSRQISPVFYWRSVASTASLNSSNARGNSSRRGATKLAAVLRCERADTGNSDTALAISPGNV